MTEGWLNPSCTRSKPERSLQTESHLACPDREGRTRQRVFDRHSFCIFDINLLIKNQDY